VMFMVCVILCQKKNCLSSLCFFARYAAYSKELEVRSREIWVWVYGSSGRSDWRQVTAARRSVHPYSKRTETNDVGGRIYGKATYIYIAMAHVLEKLGIDLRAELGKINSVLVTRRCISS
jgi:hypothetical protein